MQMEFHVCKWSLLGGRRELRAFSPPTRPVGSRDLGQCAEMTMAAPFAAGTHVAIRGLVAQPEHNGKFGTVLGADHSNEAAAAVTRGRVAVQLRDGGNMLLLKPSNLEITLLPSRLSVRLRRLPNGVLADLAVAMAELSLASAKRLADTVLAKHDPVAERFVYGIFQMPDMVACILSSLETRASVAMTCKVWKQEWKRILDRRHFLRPAPLATPEGIGASTDVQMCSPPSGEWICCTYPNRSAHILNPSMRRIHGIVRFPNHLVQGATASEDRIYMSVGGNPDAASVVVAFEPNGTRTGAEFVLHHLDVVGSFDEQAYEMAFGNELLFVVVLQDHNMGRIVALDAHTLEQQYSFGSSIFLGVDYGTPIHGITVAGDALYVGDGIRGTLQVFSLAGERLREVRGDWWAPQQVLHFNGRLYLFEYVPELGFGDEDGEENVERASVGKRLFVLSLQGETLQVWRPQVSSHWLYGMCIMGDKLILRVGESQSVDTVGLWGV